MKKLLTILVAVAATLALTSLTSCKDDKGNGKLDPSAKVYINGKDMPQQAPQAQRAAGAQERLSVLEVIKQADVIYVGGTGALIVDDWNRDLENLRIVGGSTWVIAQSGELTIDLIAARNTTMVTVDDNRRPVDTIAYLPNALMIEAEKKIRAAYDAQDYAECYRLFEEALVFYPITGAEWLELKAQGKN